jgi:hypothetical protein
MRAGSSLGDRAGDLPSDPAPGSDGRSPAESAPARQAWKPLRQGSPGRTARQAGLLTPCCCQRAPRKHFQLTPRCWFACGGAEYVPGGSLAAALARFGPFPEPLVALFARQLLLGLAYLHASRTVHRDIKVWC